MVAKSRLLSVCRPDIASQWHPTKNGELTPDQVGVSSNRKIWWVCAAHGHEWETTINHRTQGAGCPYCTGNQVLAGFNDLKTLRPSLAARWHPTRNGELKPDQVSASSHREAWWRCNRGHNWKAIINVSGRTQSSGCPYCSGKRVLAGYNDLATIRPDLAAQWHLTKNGDLTPEMVTVSSNRKAWWQCENEHPPWSAIIYSRTRGSGCPYGMSQHSEAEIRIAAELKLLLEVMSIHEGNERVAQDVRRRCCPDIVLSEHKIGIDVDGSFWHKDRSRKDKAKCSLMSKHGWRLIRVREAPLKRITSDDVFCDSLTNTKDVVDKLLRKLQSLGVKMPNATAYLAKGEPQNQQIADAEIASRGCGVDHSGSLATLRPDLAIQWHSELNGDLKPDRVAAGSDRKVWWQCENGHPPWPASLRNRTRGTGCPYCSGRKAIVGLNDLKTTHPDVAAQWHPTLNGDLAPNQVMAGSNRKIWWQCSKGHEPWLASVASRKQGTGCPFCYRQRRSEA